MKTPKNFTAWWEASEEGQAAIAEAVKDGVTERAALVVEIAKLRKALKQDLPTHFKAVDTVRAKWEKATKALRDAEAGLGQAQAVVHNIAARADAQIARLEHELREGAAPAVREFLESIGGLWDSERRQWGWIAPSHNGEKMPGRIRMEQIRAIRQQAEALLLEPDPAKAERELEPLRQGVADPMAAVA